MPNNWQSLFQSVINEYPAMKRKRKKKGGSRANKYNEKKKIKIKQVHYCLPQHIRQDYQEFNLHETSHIYKKIYIDEGLQSLCEPLGPVAKQLMAVTFQVKCGSFFLRRLGGGFGWRCHYHNY